MIPVTPCVYRDGQRFLDGGSYGGELCREGCDRIVEDCERRERESEAWLEVMSRLGRGGWLELGAELELGAQFNPEAWDDVFAWLEVEGRLDDGESRREEYEWRFQIETPTLRFWMAPVLRNPARTVHVMNRVKRRMTELKRAALVILSILRPLILRLFVVSCQGPRSFPGTCIPEPLRRILAPGGKTTAFIPLN